MTENIRELGSRPEALRGGGRHRVSSRYAQHSLTAFSTFSVRRRLLIDERSHPTYHPPLPLETMSHATSSSAPPSNFDSIFNSALDAYKKRTKQDLTSHPLLPSLRACDSPDAVLTVLREQIPALTQSQNADERLTKWLVPTVNVLYTFSTILGAGVSLVNIKIPLCCDVFL